tara:strand:+ start:3421 stop:4659 length:1239 start_codon:yes stop_codon:yes gene_type:complete
MELPNFRYFNVVWGESYTDLFMDGCLASELSPGNLPFVANKTTCSYTIYTTPEYKRIIAKSDVFKKLASMMSVRFVEFSGVSYVGKHGILSQCTRHFMKTFVHEDCAFVMMYPDVIVADGAYARILEIVQSGKRVVAAHAPRLSKETFIPALQDRFGKGKNMAPLASRNLVKLALQHLHPETSAMSWWSEDYSIVQQECLCWPVNQEGLLIRTLNMTPFMIRPYNKTVFPEYNLDAAYLLEAFDSMDDVYVVCDTDDICIMDCTSELDRLDNIKPGKINIQDVVRYAKRHAHSFHLDCLKHRIYFHCDDVSANWEHIASKSDEVVNDIFCRLSKEAFKAGETTYSAPGAGAHKPSWFKVVSPLFWLRQLRELGPSGLIKKLLSKLYFIIMQFLFGKKIRIKEIRELGPPVKQ